MYYFKWLSSVSIIVILAIGQGCSSSANAQNSNEKNKAGSENTTETSINPRRILINGNGDAVKADVGIARSKPSTSLEVGDTYRFEDTPRECVQLNTKKGIEFPNVAYELETGEISPCVRKAKVAFKEDSCTGQPFKILNESLTYTFWIKKFNGKAMWKKGEIQKVDSVYEKNKDGECVEHYSTEDEEETAKIVPLKPVPNWIKNALPNPPYKVKIAY